MPKDYVKLPKKIWRCIISEMVEVRQGEQGNRGAEEIISYELQNIIPQLCNAKKIRYPSILARFPNVFIDNIKT